MNTARMLNKIVILVFITAVAVSAGRYVNNKNIRQYFMPLEKYPELVVRDNLSGRDADLSPASRVWLHQVNTPKRLRAYFDRYGGFELDVFYNAERGTFVVHRNNPNGEVTLDMMFGEMPDVGKKFFWLDFKNLGFDNKDDALKELIAVVGRNIMRKSHIIIESSNPQYLDDFAQTGFLTSYYFPSLYRVKKKDVYATLAAAAEQYKNSSVDFVSGDVRSFNYLDYYFPEAVKLYWNLGKNMEKVVPFLLKQPKTGALLVHDRKFPR